MSQIHIIKTIWRTLRFAAFLTSLVSLSAVERNSEIELFPGGIELTLLAEPKSRVLKIANFNNPITKSVLRIEEEEIDLELIPKTDFWEIHLPRKKELKGSSIFIQTIGKPHLKGKAILVSPDKTGILKLHAHQATIVGRSLLYHPQAAMDALGSWRDPEDYVEWTIQVRRPGKYRVVVLQSCEEDQGGSQMEVRLGEETLRFRVKETDHPHAFKSRKVGTLKIESTEKQILQLHMTRLTKEMAANIRRIELIPID